MIPIAGQLIQQLKIDDQNPWPGLSAFDESAQRFFNGRREESAALRRLVMHAPLTVLFGSSGLGKTSLLQAGLFPLLRKDVLPVYIRLDFGDKETPLIDQVKAALQKAMAVQGVDAPAMGTGDTLWVYLHRAGLEFWSTQNQLLTPLFVFDQFEEVFTLGAANVAAVEQLRTHLADLIENRVPADLAPQLRQNDGLSLDSQRYKVLMSFREDFLPSMEGWKRDIPSIMRNRLRLLPMSSEQAFEAVHATTPRLAPEAICRRIVNFVAAAGDANVSNEELAVEPALLSLVCHGLNERRKELGKAQFDDELLSGTGQSIIADYYAGAVAGMPHHVQRFIERELITERGFRKACDIDDARTLYKVTEAELGLLVDRRLLRIEPARGAMRVELTHDLLTKVVRHARETQRDKERLEKETKARRRLLALGGLFAAIAITMGSMYYYALKQKDSAEQAAVQLATEIATARVAEVAARNAEGVARDAEGKAKSEESAAEAAKARAEIQARAALGHERAGSAVAAVRDEDQKRAIAAALEAIAATSLDKMVLPDAEDALRRAAFAEPTVLQRPGHASEITKINISPDGKRVATFSDHHTGIWDLALQEEVRAFGWCPDISPDWRLLVCGDFYHGYDFMEFETGKILKTVTQPRGTRFNRFGFGPGQTILWGDDIQTHLANGPLEKTFEGPMGALSPDGTLLATTPAPDSLKLWDTSSGKERFALAGAANSSVFRPDGKALAVARSDGVWIWNFLVAPNPVQLLSFGPLCLAWSPDGSKSAAMDGAATIHLVSTGSGAETLAFTLDGSDMLLPQPGTEVDCRFTSDGLSLIIVQSRGGTREVVRHTMGAIWDLTSKPPKAINKYSAQALSFDSNGKFVAGAVSSAGWVHRGNTINPYREGVVNLPEQSKGNSPAAAFTPDAKRVAIAADDSRVRIFDVSSGQRLVTFVGHTSPVWNLAFSADGKLLVTCSSSGEVKLWNAINGQLVTDLPRFHNRVLSVAFSPDGKRIVAYGYGDHLAIFDLETRKDLSETLPVKPSSSVFGIAVSANGKRLGLAGAKVSILNPANLSEMQILPAVGTPTGGLFSNRDGSAWAAASNGVSLWTSAHSWQSLQGSRGANSDKPYQLAFSRDGRRLVTPGAENTIRVWDTASAKEILKLYYQAKEGLTIKAVTFSPDERQIYAVGDDWSLYRFPVSLDDLLVEAKKRLQ